jgi:fluoroquinolone resistance protein
MDFATDKQDSYEEQSFKNVVCQQRNVHYKEFIDCTFTRCNFSETSFRECIFRNCTFKSCDLSLIKVKDATFSGAKFEDCKVVGVNWSEATWAKVGLLVPSLDFFTCTINYSTFIGITLKKANFTRCTAHDVDFTEANLTGANLTHTDFSESRFAQTNLTEADFTDATNYAIDVRFNAVKKARFSLPEAMSLLRGLDIVLVETV